MLDINDKIMCSSCFAQQSINSDICDVCGFDNAAAQENTGVLPMGMMLMGKYVVGKVLGRGGFGITYLAYDVAADKKVAIKEYFPDSLSYRVPGTASISSYTGEKKVFYETGSEKFYSEAKMLSRFNGNDNIINVIEFFYDNNTAYYVMEYVDGVDLKKYIAQHGGKLPYEEVIRVITPILYALIIVHSMDVLHRDISPDNIYITKTGGVKLLDFGAARQVLGEQSNSLSVILKQGFAPVEQYKKRGSHGPWSDIYSLGATIYYALTGKPPEESINRTEHDDLQMPSQLGIKLPPAFEQILRKMLAVKPENRWQSMVELKEALQNMTSGAKGARGLAGKPKLLAAAAGGTLLIVLLFLAVRTTFATITVSKKNYTLQTNTYVTETTYSGKWKSGAPNGEGTLTLTNGDVYTGFFTNGKLTGTGKCAYADGSVYEGQFLDNLPNGQGTFTAPAGAYVYTGWFKDGQFDGQGTEQDNRSGNVFTGAYQDGKRNGFGVEKDSAGNVILQGTWKAGEYVNTTPPPEATKGPEPAPPAEPPEGQPTPPQAPPEEGQPTPPPTQPPEERQPTPPEPQPGTSAEDVVAVPFVYKTSMFTVNVSYTGEWANNAPNGYGSLFMEEGVSFGVFAWAEDSVLSGVFKNGLMEGTGYYYESEDIYSEIEFVNGIPNGQATITDDDYYYIGNISNAQLSGQGTLTYPDEQYTGGFRDGTFNGQGTYTNANGEEYTGNFEDGSLNGQGTYTNADGEKYTGGFEDWVFSGQGTYTNADGQEYKGSFRDGTFNGQGRYSYSNGAYYEGEFVDGTIYQGRYVYPDGSYYEGEFDGLEIYNGYGYGYDANGVLTVLETWVDGELVQN
ncbi:MAG: protein kinase [Clostridiales bacterium]|nr:protein kinase [Clostridiales bacterium]